MASQHSASGMAAELWFADLDRAGAALREMEREEPRLGDADRAAFAAIGDETGRARRLAAHIALRVVLERSAGPGIRGSRLAREPGGKPQLPGSDVTFSLAHDGNLALIAVAQGCPVGADLERVRPVRLAPERRRRVLDAAASLAAGSLDGGGEDEAFMRAWVRLEALAKATGEGLARTLTALGVWHGGEPDAEAARQYLAQHGLQVCDVVLAEGIAGAVAIGDGVRVPRAMPFPVDRAGIEGLLRHGSG